MGGEEGEKEGRVGGGRGGWKEEEEGGRKKRRVGGGRGGWKEEEEGGRRKRRVGGGGWENENVIVKSCVLHIPRTKR